MFGIFYLHFFFFFFFFFFLQFFFSVAQVSFCDRSSSVVHCPSCVVRRPSVYNLLKR